MAVKWKKGPRFKPEVVLDRIASVRRMNPGGGASFLGFELEDCLPALQSMLKFPAAASELDVASLLWRGLTKVGENLTPATFLAEVNAEFLKRLATKEQEYCLLTSVSVDYRDIPKRFLFAGANVIFRPTNYPAKFDKARGMLLRSHNVPVPPEPPNYCRIVVGVKAKASEVAVNRALRAIDVQRALWCLMGNPRMQLVSGGAALRPINVVRLGSKHTIHLKSGKTAVDGIWFDPGFVEAKLFRFKEPKLVQKNVRWSLKRIEASKYGDKIVAALLRFVRAFDETDANTAFLRLWGALETLTTPGRADYGRLVQRCSFLFRETEFHRQLLEHLREYRNTSVHAGEESDRARTHCFQLQLYFVNLIWFHVRNARTFDSLEEANAFLDLPAEKAALERRRLLTSRALKFRA